MDRPLVFFCSNIFQERGWDGGVHIAVPLVCISHHVHSNHGCRISHDASDKLTLSMPVFGGDVVEGTVQNYEIIVTECQLINVGHYKERLVIKNISIYMYMFAHSCFASRSKVIYMCIHFSVLA